MKTVNKKTLTGKQILALVLSFAVMTMVMSFTGPDVQAAAKKPGKPSVTLQVNQNNVVVKWKKVKNAKTYQVYRVTGTQWKYWKKVKKSKAKKYKDTSKYLLKKSGKKYKVYKKAPKYVKLTTVKGLSYTFKGGYSTKYTFAVRAMNGKKAGDYSAAKSATTSAKPKPLTPVKPPKEERGSPATPGGNDDGDDDEGTVHLMSLGTPGKVTNLKAENSGSSGDRKITVTWTAASDATSYDVYRQKNDSNWQGPTNKTVCKYALGSVAEGATYKFKVIAKNQYGEGEPVYVTTTVPVTQTTTPESTSGSSSVTTWDQYLNKMLGYYKKELHDNYGVDINSTNKADEFKKLHAIMAVMQKYVGYSEMLKSSSPTGYTNWFYNDNNAACNGTDTSGAYYNGKDYISTIEFYAGCDAIAETQEYLAHQAGLDVYRLGKRGTSHMYVIICANNVWYNADPAFYMAPGTNGLKYGYNAALHDVGKFKMASCDIGHKLNDGTTYNTAERFSLSKVFYGSSESVTSTEGLAFINGSGGIGIRPTNATYASSDESILSFDSTNNTCTFHKTGTVYVTITYQNIMPGGQVPSITTTIAVQVTD